VAPENQDLVVIGRLGRSRGLDGDIYVTPLTDYPERFAGMRELYVNGRDGWRKWTVTATRLISGRPVLKFENVDSPEEAARMTNRELAVPRDQLVELPEGAHFVFDLVGCQAVEEGTGALVGEVIDVEKYPANDVYVVRTGEGKTLLVPVVKQYVKRVDIETKTITLATAGLLDGEES
jgi:16S rRNA processing protein RimM